MSPLRRSHPPVTANVAPNMSTAPTPRALAANMTSIVHGIARTTLEARRIQAQCLADEMRAFGAAFAKEQSLACERAFDEFASDEEVRAFESAACNQMAPGPPGREWADLYYPIASVLPAHGWPSATHVMVERAPEWRVPGVRAGQFDCASGVQKCYALDVAEQCRVGVAIARMPDVAWWWMLAQKAFNLVAARHARVAHLQDLLFSNGCALERARDHGACEWVLRDLLPYLPPTETVVRVYFCLAYVGRLLVVGTFWPYREQYEEVCYVDLPVGTHVMLCSSNWQSTCVLFAASLLSSPERGLTGAVPVRPLDELVLL